MERWSRISHSRVLIHQPTAGVQGQTTDIEIHAREILRARRALNEIYARHTGQSVEAIAADTERDRFLSADEARDYGLIDTVLGRDQTA